VRHRGAGDRVDVLRREPALEHQVDRGHHRLQADPVADEVRRVVGPHDALAELLATEPFDPRLGLGAGVGTRDQLEQLHVARWIEEVSDHEVLAERLAPADHHVCDPQARGVRRDHRVRRGELLELLEQRLLDIEPLDDRLDDQIGLGHQPEVVLEVADRDQGLVARMHERRRLGLLELVERAGREPVALGLRLLLGLGELGRHDVEQDHRDAGVGTMSGDAAAHHAGAEHGDTTDRGSSRGSRHGANHSAATVVV
jgi:hypothetical protein